MATLSVLTYNLNQGFKMKAEKDVGNANNNGNSSNISTSSQLTKTFSKITVQNVLSENNGNSLNISNNNAIVRKIKDFGMFGALSNASTNTGNSSKNILTARKRSLSALKPNNAEKTDNLLNKKVKVVKDQTNNTPKTSKKQKNLNTTDVKPAGTPGRKGLPLPQAVARRNARERNRVKQVNNGFAALRDRIPEEVAEAFETHGSGRASAKKLSKVETLRMAVEYIRSLERLLGYEFQPGDSMFSLGSGSDSNLLSSPENDNSFSLIKDEFDALSPSLDDQFDDSLSNYDVDDYFANSSAANSDFVEPANTYAEEQTNELPNITTLNGLQYIRIPGTNTYQLLTNDLFVNNSNSPPYQLVEEEQINNLIDTKCKSPNDDTTPIVVTAAEANTSESFIAITQAPASTCNGINSRGTKTTTTRFKTTGARNSSFITQTTSALSRSPVLQAATMSSSASSSSSPNASSPALQASNEQRGKFTQPAMLSPAANELLLQTCALDRSSNNGGAQQTFMLQQQLPVHIIKQEFHDIERDYTANNNKLISSPTATSTLIYQSSNMKQEALPLQQNEMHKSLINQTPLAISPPLEGSNLVSNILPSFFTHQNNACFQRILPLKSKYNESLLDSSTAVGGTLSDEGMIEALDWWDQHTPKSENGSTNI